jgi:hypothetical protein
MAVLDVESEGLVGLRGCASPAEDFANVDGSSQSVLVAVERYVLLSDAFGRRGLVPEVHAVDRPLDLPLRVSCVMLWTITVRSLRGDTGTSGSRLLVSLLLGPDLARLGPGARLVALIAAAHAGRVALIWPARAGRRQGQERLKKGL